MGICATWANTYIYNFKFEELEELPWSQLMHYLRQVKSKNQAPVPWPSTILQGKQICMSGLGYSPLTIWYQTWGEVSVSVNADPINMINTSQQQTKYGFERITWKRLEIVSV